MSPSSGSSHTQRRSAKVQSAAPSATVRRRKPMTPEEWEDYISPRLLPRSIFGHPVGKSAELLANLAFGLTAWGAFVWLVLAYLGLA